MRLLVNGERANQENLNRPHRDRGLEAKDLDIRNYPIDGNKLAVVPYSFFGSKSLRIEAGEMFINGHRIEVPYIQFGINDASLGTSPRIIFLESWFEKISDREEIFTGGFVQEGTAVFGTGVNTYKNLYSQLDHEVDARPFFNTLSDVQRQTYADNSIMRIIGTDIYQLRFRLRMESNGSLDTKLPQGPNDLPSGGAFINDNGRFVSPDGLTMATEIMLVTPATWSIPTNLNTTITQHIDAIDKSVIFSEGEITDVGGVNDRNFASLSKDSSLKLINDVAEIKFANTTDNNEFNVRRINSPTPYLYFDYNSSDIFSISGSGMELYNNISMGSNDVVGTGKFKAGDGTISEVAYGFSSDPENDTGLYLSGNDIHICKNGSDKIIVGNEITSNVNVNVPSIKVGAGGTQTSIQEINNISKMYAGKVSSAGSAISLPSGWTSSYDSPSKIYRVNHTIGNTNYIVVLTPQDSAFNDAAGNIKNIQPTYFELCFGTDGGARQAVNFGFILTSF